MAKLSISDFKRNNFVLLCVVTVGTLMFIFIPDFLGLTPSRDNGEGAFSLDLESVKEKAESFNDYVVPASESNINSVENTEYVELSPLDEVNELIKEGYIDYLVEKKRAAAKVNVSSERASLRPDIGFSPSAFLSRERAEDQLEQQTGLEFIPKNKITWNQIKSRPAKRAFQTVENSSNRLLLELPQKYVRSREALVTYISALSTVPDSGENYMTAQQAVEYLNEKDQKVTKALELEDVPREYLVEWSKISLGPTLGTAAAINAKQTAVPDFNPKPKLVDVIYRSLANHEGELDPKAEVFVVLRIELTGTEIKKAALYRNGRVPVNFIRDMAVRLPENKQEYYTFLLPVRETYTLEVVDRFGNVFEQTYRFPSIPRGLNWTYNAEGNYFNYRIDTGRNPRLAEYFDARRGRSTKSYALIDAPGPDDPLKTF